jgi:hypothetical protein
MSDPYPSRQALANKIDWEGGLMDSLDYGITTADMPPGDDELIAAWTALEASYKETARLGEVVGYLLPEPGEDDDDDA